VDSLILFGVLQGVSKTNWIYIPMVGIPWFFLYYFSFKFCILKFNLKTPGREDETDEISILTQNNTPASANQNRVDCIINGLGGKTNIIELDCCATRLRITVKDGNLVRESLLKKSGARGVLKSGNAVQVIYGPQVTVIKNELEETLNL
jgi:PTS system maltose and glucose-specific IIC component